MLFSISEFSSEFSDVCGLPAQTLRFYHSEGLLVPESVDEKTGYRSYAHHQVEQTVLVMALRQAGFGVRDVRRALDDRDRVGAMVHDHVEAVSCRRRREDEAIAETRSLLASWPEVQLGRFTGQTVLSALVPHGEAEVREGQAVDERWYDWDRADRSFHDTVRRLRGVAAARHLDQAGTAWKTPAVETPQQKIDNLTAGGPHWVAKLPVVVTDAGSLDGTLPRHVEVRSWPSRDELGIRCPGAPRRPSTARRSTGWWTTTGTACSPIWAPAGTGSSCTTTRSSSSSPSARSTRATTDEGVQRSIPATRAVIAPGSSDSGCTAWTRPVAMAAEGMPKCSAVASSWASTVPPQRCTARMPAWAS